ncbi:MAG: GIY-YIG nuclease family protein [Flavisolibacter sp.]
MYYIYILKSETSGNFYIGYSEDPFRRVIEHNRSLHNTYTSKHRPWYLIAVFECSSTQAEAVRIERYIKRQKSKTLLERLIDPGFVPSGALAQLVRVPHLRD